MIRYALQCESRHAFDMWFKDSATFDSLAAQAQVHCPECGSTEVKKAIMAPAVGKPAATDSTPTPREIASKLRAYREKVLAETTDVGTRFPEEARRMHTGEVDEKPIRGQASAEDVKALHDDGIPVLPVPPEPPKEN